VLALSVKLRPRSALALVASLAVALAASRAEASGPLLFQHGGRPTAQVGAFVARATDPVAIAYNPAAVARLEGSRYQLGLDFTAPIDDYSSASGSFSQDRLITEAPALYATWHLPPDYTPFAFGVGIDQTAWYLADWIPALFPARFLTRRQQLTLLSVHPVVAYQLGERWSVGAGARYHTGDLEEGNNQRLTSPPGTLPVYDVEVERLASADVDGLTFDLGVHYGAESWGWGLALDSGGNVDGGGRVSYRARDVADPAIQAALDARLREGSTSQGFDLPWQVRTGFWRAPYPELRLEVDVALTGWSTLDATHVTYTPDPFVSGGANASVVETRERNWKDTISVRLGVEGDLTDHWVMSGGLGWEPTPVPSSTLEPGFARGDAIVLGLGMSYRVNRTVFDVGYSYFHHSNRSASGQEPDPRVRSTYESRSQVFAVSVGWSR
jgi:long-chain fatty acid transport protein